MGKQLVGQRESRLIRLSTFHREEIINYGGANTVFWCDGILRSAPTRNQSPLHSTPTHVLLPLLLASSPYLRLERSSLPNVMGLSRLILRIPVIKRMK